LNEENGREISFFTGVDFSTENQAIQYETGNEFHVDFVLAQHLSKKLAVVLAGYCYDQISDDSGSGARLGGFQGQTVSLGPAAFYVLKVAKCDLALDFKYLREFDVRNRLDGNVYWFNAALKF